MSDDAIVMLREEHKELRREFRAFARTGETETGRRGDIVERLLELYEEHIRADADVVYPRVRELAPALHQEILTVEERDRVASRLLSELRSLEPYDEHVAPKMRVLDEIVERHVESEEHDLFPQVRTTLGRSRLQEIGRQLRSTREEEASLQEMDNPVADMVHALLP